MDKQSHSCALHIVEHPDHLCQHYLFPLKEEGKRVLWAKAKESGQRNLEKSAALLRAILILWKSVI
jgi:hypothetical protein